MEVKLMKRRHVDISIRLHWRTVGALVLWSLCTQRCSALEISLPDIGTDINYDFLSQTHIFEIANSAPTQEILESEVTFTPGKHLRIPALPNSVFHIDLVLQAEGIRDLFDPILISFDESMSLLRKDGSVIANTKNTSVGYYESDPDGYIFGWDFHEISDPAVYGFRWSITPDLIQNGQLHVNLTVDTYMSGAESILVVPEPSLATIVIGSIVGFTALPRRPSRGTSNNLPSARRPSLQGV
jgi:hypothetical protein